MTYVARLLTFLSAGLALSAVLALVWFDRAHNGDIRTNHLIVAMAVGAGVLVPQSLYHRDRLRLIRRSAMVEGERDRFAAMDPLTGLHTRGVLRKQLRRQAERCVMSSEPLALLVLHIDHFRQINKDYGHHTGDLALIGIGRCIRESARTTDIVARYGDAEFACLLPATDEDAAVGIAERLRQAIPGTQITEAGGQRLTVTVSVGVAAVTGRAAVDPADLFLRADRALLLAKANGNDRVVCARLPAPLYRNAQRDIAPPESPIDV
ncbi:MAG: GGDEF domain-containing protein [Dactylosporangium sp.]|nr:GGDEF domain-containing protein [Dactylosporangium sp.]NNJ63886.1 GGDEF domain-containing protein [Dactylosporangium sp.]